MDSNLIAISTLLDHTYAALSQKKEVTMIKEVTIINYEKIPEHIREAVQRYIEQGVLPGNFLQAVIRNDLIDSFARADDVNRSRLFDIVMFFYNEAPAGCWRSEEKMLAWHQKGGTRGIYEMKSNVLLILQKAALKQIKNSLIVGDELIASTTGKSVKVTQIEWVETHNSFRVHLDDGNTIGLQKIDKLLQTGILRKT